MDASTTFGPLEAVGQYVRTPRLSDGSGGFMVADCGVASPKNQEYARLFAGAPTLLGALRTAVDAAPHEDGCGWWGWPASSLSTPEGRAMADADCDCWKRDASAAIAAATGSAT
ncbi:hypothetical protein [Azohydromonas lata]|uniref:hypothetical protein n=1 Tax=Azohydromonas lata TaxID=45677 RepID=UPI0008359D2E|nr:hypothetical protein [Azohydromonas lata]